LQESSSCLGDSKSSPTKKCARPSNSNTSVSSGSPLRGRTKNRRTRKIILSGAQAIKEGQEKRRQADEEAAAAAAAKAAASEKKKRAAATPSSNNEEQRKRLSSPETKVFITKGRRHKQRKTERDKNNESVEREMSNEFAFSQSSQDSKSVRFAESANGKERDNIQAERDSKRDECESNSIGSSSATERKRQQTQQPSSCLRTKPMYPPASSQSTNTNASKQTPPTSPASNSSVSYSSFSKIHGNGARKKRHKPRRFQLGYSPNDSSQQHESSVNSSSASSSSNKSPEKAQVVTLGRSFGYSSRDFDTTPDAAAAAQNVGNYRMLVDELSYLCSAILHCKQQQKHRIGLAKAEVVCKHNSITAGAACDIGELISQPGTRTALLMLSSSGGRTQQGQYKNGGKSVGALGAILEAMACAPPVVDWVDVCKEVIIGAEVNELKSDRLNGDSNATGFELDNNNLAAVPLSSLAEKTKFDIIASKALSIVSLFVSIDCTGSNRAAITPSSKMERNLVKGARNSILQHQQSLRGIARLISDDPVVNTYLRSVAAARGVPGVGGGDELQLMDTADEGSIASKSSHTSTLSSISMSKASSQQTVDELAESHVKNADPTKAGRHRNRKRKKLMAIRENEGEEDSAFDMPSASSKSPQSPMKSKDKSGKPNCLDFNSEGSSAKPKPTAFVKKVRLNSVEKYTEKLSLALSRAKIPQLESEDNLLKSDDDIDSMCQHCKIWGKDAIAQSCLGNVCITSSSLAIDAAEYIITGKDSSSGEGADDAEMNGDDDDSDEDDFLGDSNQNSGDEVSSNNPILFANEMLRKSGSLPDYSRAYASTLSAILLAYKSNDDGDQSRVTPTPCHRCITYLQKRASSLSGVVDSLCCLSPKASVALSCPESNLVPGLLKVIADLSFGNSNTASTSIRDEILTSLKTLTSLTHENSVACEQLVRPYNWDNPLPISMENTMVASDQTMTGVCIIFSYLLRIVSTKQGKVTTNHDDDIRDKSSERYSYDTTIFCLNILTNIVEMVPHSAKHMIENIIITDEGMNAISWLTRWVVSTTSGFQKSIMQGSFGSEGETETSAGGDELKAGEEGNLVTAGNGFVLLAYLMLDDESSSSTSSKIRDAVIKELPFDESGTSGGIQYMIKTLKAFCNFYHFSVGDLSVAVIAPVVKLIAGLQKLDVMEQRKAWL
jgi:hypothetical protein